MCVGVGQKGVWEMDYYSGLKTNEILPFAATCMDIQNIMLNEISQRRTNAIFILYMRNLKNNTNEYICKTETDSQL